VYLLNSHNIVRQNGKVERKKKFFSPEEFKGNLITSMIYKWPYVWLGTDNLIFRVDAATEKIVDTLQGHTRIIHK